MTPPIGDEPMVATRHNQGPGGFPSRGAQAFDDASGARTLVYGLFFKSDAGLKHSSPRQSRVKVRPSARRELDQISKKRASSNGVLFALSRCACG